MSHNTSVRARIARIAVAVLVVAGITTVVAPSVSTEEATAAGSTLRCDQNTLYGITTTGGDLIEIDATTGATTTVVGMSPATNALGLSYDGTYAWGFHSGGQEIVRYDPIAGTPATTMANDPAGTQTAIRGAVNPVTNIFYYAGGGTSARLAAYDIDNNVAIGQVGTITGLGGNNGDMAFGSDGTLYIVDGDKVYQVSSVPTVAGGVSLAATQILTLPGGTNSPGIAYSSDGYLYLAASSSSSTIYKINPSSGASAGTITISSSQPVVDLATCNYANSLRGQADVRSRAAATDQFTITNSGNGVSTGNTAVTSGNTPGVQPVTAGPNLTVGGANYTVTLTAAGTTTLTNYSIGWTCTNNTTGTEVAHGTGTVASFTNPASTSAEGTDVSCTFLVALLPHATNDTYTTPINTTLTKLPAAGILANDTGADIVYVSNVAAQHGVATIASDGSFSYVPTAGFTGADTFTYTMADANGTTSTASVTIQVTPVAVNDAYATPAGIPLTISDLTANDTPSTLTVQSVGTPAHGTAVLNGDGTVTYTPAPGYTGPDTFTYTAVDSSGQPTTATVTMTVAALAVDDQKTGARDTPTSLQPLTNDTPSAGATFDATTLRIFDGTSWVTQVTTSKGVWDVVGNELRFTPVAGYDGTASMRYEITDTLGNTVAAKATVFYPGVAALAYTNVARPGVAAWGVGIEALLLGLSLVLFAGIRRRRQARAPRHSTAV